MSSWPKANVSLEDWSLPEFQSPEIDHLMFANIPPGQSPAEFGGIDHHVDPLSSNTWPHSLDYASTASQLPVQRGPYTGNHDIAGLQVASNVEYLAPSSRSQSSFPLEEERHSPLGNSAKGLKGDSPSAPGKKADDTLAPLECGWKNCKRPHSFKNKGTLMRHIKTQHVDLREIHCTILGCDKSFSRKDKMEDHVYRVHRNRH